MITIKFDSSTRQFAIGTPISKKKSISSKPISTGLNQNQKFIVVSRDVTSGKVSVRNVTAKSKPEAVYKFRELMKNRRVPLGKSRSIPSHIRAFNFNEANDAERYKMKLETPIGGNLTMNRRK